LHGFSYISLTKSSNNNAQFENKKSNLLADIKKY